MKANVGSVDRGLRVVVGLALLTQHPIVVLLSRCDGGGDVREPRAGRCPQGRDRCPESCGGQNVGQLLHSHGFTREPL
jgi:hypothetical protein